MAAAPGSQEAAGAPAGHEGKRVVTLDLDRPGDVLRLWAEFERIHSVRQLDPGMREAVLVHVDKAVAAGRMSDEEADEVRQLLDVVHPRGVLAGYLKQLVPDRPALGAYRDQAAAHRRTWRERLRAEEDYDWQEHPERLVQIVATMRRFCTDETRVAEAACELAAKVGIPDELAVEFAAEGIRRGREWGRGHG